VAIILVGELNPYGADPRHALFCEPPNSAGGRMQRLVCGLSRREYLKLSRVNLCVGRWSARYARESADKVLRRPESCDPIVMLGRKVAKAFADASNELEVSPFCGGFDGRWGNHLISLPHPSGLCRAWNEPGAFGRARELLREACPEVQWGELEDGKVRL
jgi:hypothetical protein